MCDATLYIICVIYSAGGDLILCDPLLLSRNLCVKKIEIFKNINYLHSAFREEKVRFRKPIDGPLALLGLEETIL